VLNEVISLVAALPQEVTLGQVPSLFSTLKYFPLNNKIDGCVDNRFFSVADSCTTSTLPKTFKTSSFARRYSELLSNTTVTPSSSYQGDNGILREAAETLNQCCFAARAASSDNGGICYYAKGDSGLPCQFVPNYHVSWPDNQQQYYPNISIKVDVWRSGSNAPWQKCVDNGQLGERLKGTIIYRQLRIAVVCPQSYDPSSQQGWYDKQTVQAIRDGGTNDLIYSPLIVNEFREIELRRARLFVVVGQVDINLVNSSKSFAKSARPMRMAKASRSTDSSNRVDIQLTPHLRIPRAKQTVAKRQKSASSRSESTTSWNSGDLYQELDAGYILAVIEDDPLRK